MDTKTPLTSQDLEFFQNELESHSVALAYIQSHYDVKSMTLDEFNQKCLDAYNYIHDLKI